MKTDMCYYKVGAAEEKCFKKKKKKAKYNNFLLMVLGTNKSCRKWCSHKDQCPQSLLQPLVTRCCAL